MADDIVASTVIATVAAPALAEFVQAALTEKVTLGTEINTVIETFTIDVFNTFKKVVNRSFIDPSGVLNEVFRQARDSAQGIVVFSKIMKSNGVLQSRKLSELAGKAVGAMNALQGDIDILVDAYPELKKLGTERQNARDKYTYDNNVYLCGEVNRYISCLNSSCGGGKITKPSRSGSRATLTGQIITPNDPNEKLGAQGVGVPRYLSGNTALPYAVFFENQPMATAAARDVTVTDTLDSTIFDLASITLGPITFANTVLTPPSTPLAALGSVTLTADLQPQQKLLVKVVVTLDTTTGLIKWSLQSIDPNTGQPPTDPLTGFLPPGQEGSVLFTVAPKMPVTGTQVMNKATIVFDVNPPIDTPVWRNTVDNTPPVSKVGSLASTQTSPTFAVQWAGTDLGSGIQDFTIYASDNGSAFTPWQTSTPSTQAMYTGVAGHTYRFYSIARDLVGNTESSKSAPEASTLITATGTSTTPLSLTFSQSTSFSPPTQTFVIAGNAGGFAATAKSTGDWLQITPLTGTSPAMLTVSVNPAGLSPGSYTGKIVITFSDGTPSQTVNVAYTISAPGQINVSSNFLQFTAERGSIAPEPQTLQVTSDILLSVTVTGQSGIPWLSVTPSNAIVPSNFSVVVSPAGLSNGVYEGLLSISAPGASVAPVRVRLTIQDRPQFLISPNQFAFTYQVGGGTPAIQMLSVNATGRHFNFNATTNKPWLSVSPQVTMTPVSLSISVSTVGMNPGVYDATVTLSSPDATNSPLNLPVRLSIQGRTPIVGSSNILNAATLAPGPLAPGSLFTITGTNLAASTQSNSGIPVSSSLGGVTVSFGGVVAPLLYVSTTQINGQVPFEVAEGQTTIVVTNAGTTSASVAATIAKMAPGLFKTSVGRAAVLNQDGTANDVSNPALSNSVVSAFLTGQGPVDPPVATGWPGLSDPLSRTALDAVATFDGQATKVVFAGLAPTLVGVLQVNLCVPTLSSGDHLFSVAIGGAPSNAGVITVGAGAPSQPTAVCRVP